MGDVTAAGEAWQLWKQNSDAVSALYTIFGGAVVWVVKSLTGRAEQRKLRDQVTRARSRALGLGRTVQLAFEKNEAVLLAVKPKGSGTSPLPQYAALDTLVQRSWDAGDGVAAAVSQHIFDIEPQSPEAMEATIQVNGFGGAYARELRNCAKQGAKATPPTKPWWCQWLL